MDYIGATPQANPLLGLLAERLKQAQEFAAKPFGYSNPPAEMLMNLLGVPAVQQTAERLAYGEPLTTGRGMTTQIRPEAVEAALTVAPVAGLLGKGAETAAMAAGRAGERYAEKVVPQIMERGGLPAQLLGDLAQGSRRQIFVPASQEEAFQAAKLLRKKTPEEVWKETGVAKFGDDFVKEISDKESSFNTAADIHESAEKIRQRNAELKQILNESRSTYPDLFPKELTAARKPLREEIKANQGLLEMPRGYVSDSSFSGNMAAIAYEHPELYKQVPEMKGVIIRQGRDLGDFLGAYENSPSRPLGSIDITKLGLKNDPRSTATHEMQHAVQEFYGLPGGGTPEEFMREAIADRNLLNSKIDDLNKKMREVSGTPEYDKIMEQRMALTQEYLDKGYGDMASVYKNANDQYQRLAGEAQSRLAQTRIDLTPEERRQYFPFAYGKENYGLDVKPEDLIFRQGGLLGQSKAAEATDLLSYRGSHTAPGPDFGAPLHDLTGGGQMYPADVYSSKAAQYYGGGVPYDQKAFDIAQSFKDKPNATVTIYRAVPKEMSNSEKLADIEKQMSAYMKRGTLPKDAENFSNGSKWYDWAYDQREALRNMPDEPAAKIGINSGDWVTLTKEYAKDHGESALNGQYKIISKKVKAKDIWTNADSIHEFGYHPSE